MSDGLKNSISMYTVYANLIFLKKKYNFNAQNE